MYHVIVPWQPSDLNIDRQCIVASAQFYYGDETIISNSHQ